MARGLTYALDALED